MDSNESDQDGYDAGHYNPDEDESDEESVSAELDGLPQASCCFGGKAGLQRCRSRHQGE